MPACCGARCREATSALMLSAHSAPELHARALPNGGRALDELGFEPKTWRISSRHEAGDSRAGNRTLVLSVTAIDTNHYTTREIVCVSASAGNRTRGESMATIHFTTKPLMPQWGKKMRPCAVAAPPRLQSYALPLSYRPRSRATLRSPRADPGSNQGPYESCAKRRRGARRCALVVFDDGGIRTHARRPVP